MPEANFSKATVEFEFYDKSKYWRLHFPREEGEWLSKIFFQLSIDQHEPLTYSDFKNSYGIAGLTGFDAFIKSKKFKALREAGLLILQ
jgi:hypothetical protein